MRERDLYARLAHPQFFDDRAGLQGLAHGRRVEPRRPPLGISLRGPPMDERIGRGPSTHQALGELGGTAARQRTDRAGETQHQLVGGEGCAHAERIDRLALHR